MAYRLRYYVDIDWVGDGTGGTMQGILQANNPVAGDVGSAQTMRLQGGQYVPGGDSPSGSNFTTATTAMGTDISTQINVAATLAQIQAWATGGY